MNKTVRPGALLAELLLTFLLYASCGAIFAWGLQHPLESILDKEIRYWDLFWVAVLSIAFINPNPIKVE